MLCIAYLESFQVNLIYIQWESDVSVACNTLSVRTKNQRDYSGKRNRHWVKYRKRDLFKHTCACRSSFVVFFNIQSIFGKESISICGSEDVRSENKGVGLVSLIHTKKKI